MNNNMNNNMNNMDNMDNIELCHSIKNKATPNIQCNNKTKMGEIFCGIHLNCKNKVSFFEINNINQVKQDKNEKLDEILNNDTSNDTSNSTINSTSNSTSDSTSNDTGNENDVNNINQTNNKILSIIELFDVISKNKNISIYTLRQSIKKSYLCKTINTKQSKSLLVEEIKKVIEKNRYYDANQYSIIKIQTFYRRWIIYKRSLCVNDNDILTFTCKYEIPNQYFYRFKDSNTQKWYAYDIRTLLKIIESKYPSCPYTFRTFTEDEKDQIYLYKIKLINLGLELEVEKKVLTFEEQTEMKMKDVFYEINMLDNYTNHFWFKNLELYELIDFYLKMQDLWSYRTDMTIEAKKRIISNGTVFNVPAYIIKGQKSKIKLQNVILDEFVRLISEGINIDERKLGAMLILTILVEVSHDAASALPHLIQNVY
jgi:hypothetical protein